MLVKKAIILFSFTVVVSCGNGTLSPSCSLCPRNNHSPPKSWCDGSCYYDDETKTCTERKYDFMI